MKKYRCTVCGYIHEGEPLPDYCPNCGANKDKFDPVIDPEDMVDNKI